MLRQFISSKAFFFIITTSIILGLNLTPLILQTRHAPAGRTFGLIHNNVQDFYFYQALMNEGANGAWLTSDPYTSEPHQPSIIFSYFLWLGKLSKLFNLSFALTYHLIRIIISFLFLFFIFYLLYFISVPHPRLTYIFFLFAAPFMHTINDYGTLKSVPFMNWWNGIDPIRRAAFLPHHMFGGLLLVLSIILIFQYIKTPASLARPGLLKLILLGALMAFVHTPSLLILLLVLPATMIFFTVINGLSRTLKWEMGNGKLENEMGSGKKNLTSHFNIPHLKSHFTLLLLYWITGLFFLIIMILQTKSGFPWSQYIDWEKNLQFPLERELIGALGMLFPFSLIGIYNAIKSKKFENIFIVCWLVMPFLFIPIAPKLNLSNIRLIQGIPYLPLAILAIIGIKTVENFLKKFSNFKFQISNLFVYLFICLFVYFTLPTLQWSLKDQIREFMPVYGNVYLDNRLFDAFAFIKNNFPAKTITLSSFYAGNYLPVYTDTVSFTGHFGYTYNWQEKEKKMQKFFEGKMSVEEAKNFLVNNKITLVFQGPEEKPLYKDYLYPGLLKVVYDQEVATLYSVNENL